MSDSEAVLAIEEPRTLDEWISDQQITPFCVERPRLGINKRWRTKMGRSRIGQVINKGFGHSTIPPIDIIDSLPQQSEDRPSANSSHQWGLLREPQPETPVFPYVTPGRGELPTAEPPSTNTWSVAKWKTQLELLTFDPTNEIELEHWFEDASFKILAHSAKASTVIKVMQLNTSPQLRLILGAVLLESSTFKEIEHIADAIAKRLFRGDRILELFERNLFTQQPCQTVFLSFAKFRRIEETYAYLCRRRLRHSAIGKPQLAVLAMQLLPTEVTRAIRRAQPAKQWDPMDLFSYALDMEDALQNDSDNSKALIAYPVSPILPKIDANMGTKTCFGCGGDHLRKNCPHRKDRCAECGKIGHISRACRNKAIFDSAGRRRVVALPKQTGVTVETQLDNTAPAQLKTVAGVVDKLLSTTEHNKEKARQKYALKKAETKPSEPVKQLPVRDVLQITNVDLDEEEEAKVFEVEEEYGLQPIYDIYNMEDEELPPIPKKLKLLKVSLYINLMKTEACLDTGALLNIMSQFTALQLRMTPDPLIEKLGIRSVHQEIRYAPVSQVVSVSFDNIHVVKVRFAIINENIKTLISLPTMQALQTTINLYDKTFTSFGCTYPCLTLELDNTTNTPKVFDTIQQSGGESVATAIHNKSLKWSFLASPPERKRAIELLQEFSDVWFKPKVGKCTTVSMEIKVCGKPKRVVARPTPVHLRKELNRQINDLLAAKVIKPAPDCPWVSNCHLVPKMRTNKWRLVIDYRYVNSLITDDGYQIPNVQDLLVRLSGSKLFTLIDLNWGFWNVSIEQQSQEYTGFVVPERGVFVWTVIPFGLKISPTVFQRAIEKALRPLIDQGRVSVYIDDIIIFTDTVSMHLTLLQQVLTLLRETGFFINFEKSEFLREEVLYLGHLISENTLKPDPAKIQGIANAIAPKNKHTLLSFCAAANYLRAFIPKFSELMEPLTNLTGKYIKFVWKDEHQQAFEEIKNSILNACYLAMPNWNKPFIIFTDASDVAVAATMAQLGDNNNSLNFISFASKKLSGPQKNWSPTEKELYAIVWACEHYEIYIKGQRPLIFSDHKSLRNLLSLHSPKVHRWALRLSEFKPYIQYVNGSSNNVADWLSRALPDESEEKLIKEISVPEVYHLVHELEDQFTLPSAKEMAQEAKLEETNLPAGTLDWYNGAAYGRHSRRLYIPEKFRLRLLLWFHTSRFGGHQGITRTVNRLRKYVWWPNMQSTVVQFINSCPICSAIKPLRSTGGTVGALNRPNLFDLVSVDFIGPRKFINKSFYILVIVDHYSRFMVAITSNTTANPVAENILRDHWVSKFGIPRAILADRASCFTSKLFKQYICQTLGSKLYHVSTEYPQGNGINESSHRILETAIRTYPVQIDTQIEAIIADTTLLYNVTPNRKIGDTPASLVFGCDLHIPGLESLETANSEEARLTLLRNRKGVRLLLKQLNEIEEMNPPQIGELKNTNFKVGDIVTYRLSKSERDKVVHLTKEIKYNASRSFPQRVVKVTSNTLVVTPLWTTGTIRTAPKEECKLISSFIPELLREKVQVLYPSLPWLPEHNQESSSSNKPANKLTEESNGDSTSQGNNGNISSSRKRLRYSTNS